jgi:hypothetical protein
VKTNAGSVLVVDALDVRENIPFKAVTLDDPIRMRGVMNAFIATGVMSFTKKKAIKEHVINKSVRVMFIKVLPVKGRVILSDRCIDRPIYHRSHAPFNRVVVSFKFQSATAYIATSISFDQQFPCLGEQRICTIDTPARHIDIDRKGSVK